ncbi:hypothetical protein ONS95_008747 [Cadophora gregata]|uniref:uncharacterized protein n=1 Tax=Cadophora gregata TaxID=51156 RepID=UPI0026DD0285|nr:uncharacterized protein ONS95_008747 [Cadophora gregata]KAK0123740.1 hypothetical protein ONS95_008747 [Cadophora gregata]
MIMKPINCLSLPLRYPYDGGCFVQWCSAVQCSAVQQMQANQVGHDPQPNQTTDGCSASQSSKAVMQHKSSVLNTYAERGRSVHNGTAIGKVQRLRQWRKYM